VDISVGIGLGSLSGLLSAGIGLLEDMSRKRKPDEPPFKFDGVQFLKTAVLGIVYGGALGSGYLTPDLEPTVESLFGISGMSYVTKKGLQMLWNLWEIRKGA
jgi:hypothetical protein